jgi:hypothetical protein
VIDSFVLLTPLLLLGVVALLGFVGCFFKPNPPVGRISISPTSGPTAGGTPVTITDENSIFASNAKVKFGSSPDQAEVPGTVVSKTVLTAVTPAHASGPVTVEVDYQDSDGDDWKDVLPDGSFFTFFDPVVPLQPPALSRKPGGTTNTATLTAFPGIKRVVATVQWGAGGGAALTSLSAPGVTFTQLGPTDTLNPQQVATFYANADLSSGIAVTATLTANSNTDFNLLLSAYDNADPASPPVTPISNQGTGTLPGPSLSFATASLAAGDVIHAVAIARLGNTTLSGSLVPGQGFTAQAGQNNYLLLETYLLQQTDIDAGQISVTATDSNGTGTSRWYLFATAIKHA